MIFLSADTKSTVQAYTLHNAWPIKTEYFTTALKLAESQGYRNFRNRTFCNGVGGKRHLLYSCTIVREPVTLGTKLLQGRTPISKLVEAR